MKTKLPFISIMLAISVVLFAWLLVSTIGSRTREGAKDAAQLAAKIKKPAKIAVVKVVAAKSAVAARNPPRKYPPTGGS